MCFFRCWPRLLMMEGPLKQLTAVKSAMCWGHFEWAWALPRKSNRNLCDLNFSACIKCLKNKIYDRQYCIPSPQAATSLSLTLSLTLSLKVLQGAQSLWNRHEIYAFANWQQQQVDNMRLNLWNIVFSPSTRALSHVPHYSSLPVAGPRLLSAFRFWQFSTADFPISAHFVTATRSLLKIFVLATNPHPNPNAEWEWEWKFESDGGWRNGECECDAIFISLCLFVFVSWSLCLCVRQTEGKDTRKTQRECVGGSANTKLIERERKGEKESEKICQFAPTAMLNL